MKAIKRIIASVFVCMFAVTGGLNALALTPTEDSSTVASQPVSEGISSETSSQTGSVSSGLSSRADDSGLKDESSSSRTPEASSEVDSDNSQSSSEPASSETNSTSISASAGMLSAEISGSTEAKQAATTVDVSYKTHVQTLVGKIGLLTALPPALLAWPNDLRLSRLKPQRQLPRAAFVIEPMYRPMDGWIGSATEPLVVLPGKPSVWKPFRLS